MFKCIPALNVDRVGHSAWILRKGAAPRGIVARADYKPWTSACRISVIVVAGVKDKVAPVIAIRCPNRR